MTGMVHTQPGRARNTPPKKQANHANKLVLTVSMHESCQPGSIQGFAPGNMRRGEQVFRFSDNAVAIAAPGSRVARHAAPDG